MKTLAEHLSQYAAYHRDRRNVATHFVGIPMIVVAVAILLSRPQWELVGLFISPAVFLAVLSGVFYLRLDRVLGVLMCVLLLMALWIGDKVANLGTFSWLVSGIGLFVVGWMCQFVGQCYEGRKPAFIDDIVGLIVGPLFVLVEVLFLLGMQKTLEQDIKSASD